MVSWPAVLEGGKLNRSIVTLTDLYATLAHVVGHSLAPDEAQDSHDVFAYWSEPQKVADTRPRVFFCHLGPPYLNDALAIRQGPYKLIVDGGLAMPSISKGTRGASVPKVFYDLKENLFENGASSDPSHPIAVEMASTLLKIHNQGYARDLNLSSVPEMVVHQGWHNLRNDVTGEIGFEFQLRSGGGDKLVTHLGMFDDDDKDTPARAARSIPTEGERDQPSARPAESKKRQIVANHVVRLLRLESDKPTEIVRCQISPGDTGELRDSFRYIRLDKPVRLKQSVTYVLLMSTEVADGDRFRDPASFDGLSPLVHPDVIVRRSMLVPGEDVTPTMGLPAFEDLSNSYSRFRTPIGPTLLFQQ